VEHFIQALGIYRWLPGAAGQQPAGHGDGAEPGRAAAPIVRVVYDIDRQQALEPSTWTCPARRPWDGVLGHEEPANWNLDPNRS